MKLPDTALPPTEDKNGGVCSNFVKMPFCHDNEKMIALSQDNKARFLMIMNEFINY